MSMSSTGKRRATPPSAETPNRAAQRSFSPYQGRLGPSSVRILVASATLARVWSAKTVYSRDRPTASSGASTAGQPMSRARRRMVAMRSREPAARAATHISPVGPVPTEKAATPTAATPGTSRRVAMARSTNDQVSRAPSAITGSGRRPLSNAIQNARNTAAPVHCGRYQRRVSRPSRGTTSRLMMSQDRIPQTRVGSRIHGLAVETSAMSRRIS